MEKCRTCMYDFAGWCGLKPNRSDYPAFICSDYSPKCGFDDTEDIIDVPLVKECNLCCNNAYWNGSCYVCDECGNCFN